MAVDPHDIHIVLEDVNGDGTFSREGHDDIKRPIRETIGQYLRDLTHEPMTSNRFPLASGISDVRLVDDSGNPVALSRDSAGAEQTFVSLADPNLERSTSGIAERDTPLRDYVTKGRTGMSVGSDPSVEGPRDGHDLLQSVRGEGAGVYGRIPEGTPGEGIVKRTSAVLNTNRFSPGDGSFTRQRASTDVVASRQRIFGQYDPSAPGVTNAQLTKIGRMLSLRSTGEYAARADGADPDDGSVIASALAPGEAQLGLTKLAMSDLNAAEVFRSMFGEPITSTLESDEGGGSLTTYGNINSSVEHFDGIMPTGMIALAIALITAAQVSLRALVTLLSIGSSGGKAELRTTDSIGRMELGKNRMPPEEKGMLGAMLEEVISLEAMGINPTSAKFDDAVSAGLDVFFGSSGGLLGAALGAIPVVGSLIGGGDTFERVRKSPGFYVVVVKNVAMSLNTIYESASGIDSITKNPLGFIEGIAGVIDAIRRSRLVSFLNLLAQLGDMQLMLESKDFPRNSAATRVSILDQLPDNAATHVMKARQRGSLRLAWRGGSVPSKMLLPSPSLIATTILKTDGQPNPFELFSLRNEHDNSSKFQLAAGRLPSETVRAIEAELEAEYMPFYFHDLRTNEIVAFHAFIDTLTDGYAAAWEPEDAFGRVEPVRTYKGTVRQIDMSFWVAATSATDFDELYVKVNKLTTLVYPKYSLGNVVKDDQGNSFIQPFSQVIAGGPVVRIRLGDLFKTNFSRFALAKMFGLGSDKFVLTEDSKLKELVDGESKYIDAITKVDAILARYEMGRYQVDDKIMLRPRGAPAALDDPTGYRPAAGGGISISAPIPAGVPSMGGTSKHKAASLCLPYPVPAKIIEVSGQGSYVVEIEQLEFEVLNVSADNKWIAHGADFTYDKDDIRKSAFDALGFDESTDPSNWFKATTDFFSEENNVIIRSFKECGGQGLAGVIPTLSFDWMAGQSWDTSRWGARAPKVFKVSLSFMPIHDVPPGIDYTGFNRAPLYNAGGLVNAIAGNGVDDEMKGKERFDAAWGKLSKKANEKL